MVDSGVLSFLTIQKRNRLLIMGFFILLAIILVNIYFLLNGITLIFSQLYYIPVLLAVTWFGKKGFYVSLYIIVFYLVSTWILIPELDIIFQSFMSALIMVSVALIISLLSDEFILNYVSFNSFFANIPAPSVKINESGNIVKINEKFSEIIADKYPDPVNRSILDLDIFTGKNRQNIYQNIRCCYDGIVPEEPIVTTEVITPDGTRTYNVVFIILNQKGRCFGFIISLYDISEVLEAKNSILKGKNLLDNIVRSLPVPAYVVDNSHKITRWNVALEDYTGISSEKMIGTCNAWKPFFDKKTPMLADLLLDYKPGDPELSSYDRPAFGINGLEETRSFRNKDGDDVWFRMSAELLKDECGAILGAIQVFEDITGLKMTESELIKSRGLYREVVDLSSEYIVRFRQDHIHTFCNQAYSELFGKNPDEILGSVFESDVFREDIPVLLDFYDSLSPENYSGSVENRIILPDGSIHWVRWDIIAFFDEKDNVREYQAIGRDFTEEKNAVDYLLKAEKKFRDLCDFLPQTVFELDIKRNVVFLNKRGYEKLGYSPDDLKKGLGFLDLVTPEDHNRALDNIVLSTYGKELGIKYSMRKKDGTIFGAMLFTSAIMRGNTPVGIRGIVIDLSNVEEPDAAYNLSHTLYIENLKESLKEKETLLKEVHHRVKNNLQIITSILRLHSYNTADQELKNILQECYNQVYSMSMLHEKIYRSDTLADVDADDHIRSLCSYLINEISARGGDVRLSTDIDPEIRFSLNKGIPLSLMLNEMITNSLKYGFTGDNPGQISISLNKDNSGNYLLVYSDNGCGLPEGFRIENSDSLGFELIINLAEQLDGKLEIENNEGLKYILVFPAD